MEPSLPDPLWRHHSPPLIKKRYCLSSLFFAGFPFFCVSRPRGPPARLSLLRSQLFLGFSAHLSSYPMRVND